MVPDKTKFLGFWSHKPSGSVAQFSNKAKNYKIEKM